MSASSPVSQSLLASPNLGPISLLGIQLFLATKVTQAGLGIETGVLGQSRREMLSAKSIW